MVRRGTKLRVPARPRHMLSLGGYRCNVPPLRRRFFLRRRTRADPSVAPVVTHTIHGVVHNCFVVNVVNVGDVYVHHRAVIEKVSTIPTSAGESHAEVAEPIVDTAIKTYCRTPEPFMPQKCFATPAPPARGPQKSNLRRDNPCARHPIVIRNIVELGRASC